AQAIDGPVIEPLLERLVGDAQRGGEVLELGVGVGHPAEDEALDEAGAGDLADAADEAGLPGRLVGGVGPEGLQGGGQGRYADPHGGLLWCGCSCLNTRYQRGSSYSCFLWGPQPPVFSTGQGAGAPRSPRNSPFFPVSR